MLIDLQIGTQIIKRIFYIQNDVFIFAVSLRYIFDRLHLSRPILYNLSDCSIYSVAVI